MPYKDKDKQREAVKLAARRFREKKKNEYEEEIVAYQNRIRSLEEQLRLITEGK